MMPARPNANTIPTKLTLPFTLMIDSLVVTALVYLGPFFTVLASIFLIVTVLLAISPVGLAAILGLVSHIVQVEQIGFSAVRSAKWVLLGGLLCITIIRFLIERRTITYRLEAFEKAFGAFLLWGLFCSLFAIRPFDNVIELARLATLLLVYIITRESITKTSHVRLLMAVFLVAVFSSSLYAITEVLTGPYLRTRGFFANPNGLGAFVTYTIPLLLVGFLCYRRLLIRLLFGSGILLGIVALLLSWSRGSWLAIATFTVVFLILEKKWKLLKISGSVILFIILLLAISERTFTDFAKLIRLSAGTTKRVTLWEHGIESARDHLLVGCGFELTYKDVRGRETLTEMSEIAMFQKEEGRYNPHNFYIIILLATGIPGFLLIVLVHIHLFKMLATGRGTAQPRHCRLLSTALIATLIGSMVAAFFDSGRAFSSGSVANYFWLMLGITTAVRKRGLEL